MRKFRRGMAYSFDGEPLFPVAAFAFPLRDFSRSTVGDEESPFALDETTRFAARIAPFARVNHYKEAVKSLKNTLPALHALCGGDKNTYRIYCNSHEIDEKRTARECGLGFQGKNTLVITKEYGSRCVLAFVRLPYTGTSAKPNVRSAAVNERSVKKNVCSVEKNICSVEKNVCSPCNRCAEACPTGALTGDGRLIREKCLQWYASGHEKDAPESVRAAWGNILYGCTICADVCPRQGNAEAGEEPWTEGARVLPETLDAEKIAAARDGEIENYFHGTALGMKWLGAAALRRNAQWVIDYRRKLK